MVKYTHLYLTDQAAYRTHYERNLCCGGIATHDGIPVYFRKEAFDHAFFESSGRRGEKDVFSWVRAERMDWIATALADSNAQCFQGWNATARRYEPTRRVAVVMVDFAVIIALSRRREGALKASFVTCFKADNSIPRILASPKWKMEDCLNEL
ncbi:MAG: hypothetical protein INF85_00595 [Roseomonas sp.]|nr:hypothetical protein [Roseomonas sp.]